VKALVYGDLREDMLGSGLGSGQLYINFMKEIREEGDMGDGAGKPSPLIMPI
jgi:hypothetical protein